MFLIHCNQQKCVLDYYSAIKRLPILSKDKKTYKKYGVLEMIFSVFYVAPKKTSQNHALYTTHAAKRSFMI